MKNHSKIKERMRSNSGYVSIESVFAMSFFLIIFLLCIGFFSYVHPYTKLDREVHTLATLAQRQGGLTVDDVQRFEDRIANYAFVDLTKGVVEVNAHTILGNMDAIGIDGLEDAGTYYVKRDNKDFIELTVSIPSQNVILKPVANFFGVGGVIDHYTFKETFMSERY
ncbi:hypothetical protein ACFVS2_21510 [Brevibacillus sp. NPDC058079]|uniref:hypothetical protein n=1 Tax=Brevibacillus sp. NPDC058079 TaxID=3346330 RepID=UPI0036E04AEA